MKDSSTKDQAKGKFHKVKGKIKELVKNHMLKLFIVFISKAGSKNSFAKTEEKNGSGLRLTPSVMQCNCENWTPNQKMKGILS
ncbi:MAG: hypothetical protein U5R06_01580 [candidate division KSB1 bacterium]|nr:hypothetical protein [candidate division KSB1 bacterium]